MFNLSFARTNFLWFFFLKTSLEGLIGNWLKLISTKNQILNYGIRDLIVPKRQIYWMVLLFFAVQSIFCQTCRLDCIRQGPNKKRSPCKSKMTWSFPNLPSSVGIFMEQQKGQGFAVIFVLRSSAKSVSATTDSIIVIKLTIKLFTFVDKPFEMSQYQCFFLHWNKFWLKNQSLLLVLIFRDVQTHFLPEWPIGLKTLKP